jgi:hypothetical protein
MGMFGDFSKSEKKKKKKASVQVSLSHAPVFKPPGVVPKKKDK